MKKTDKDVKTKTFLLLSTACLQPQKKNCNPAIRIMRLIMTSRDII